MLRGPGMTSRSYAVLMATRDEQHTTRARANLLRQTLSSTREAANPWTRPEIAAVMDLCLSCKACKSECPSNVDMARLKAEWQQHLHDECGVPLAEHSGEVSMCGPANGAMAALLRATQEALVDAVDWYSLTATQEIHADAIAKAILEQAEPAGSTGDRSHLLEERQEEAGINISLRGGEKDDEEARYSAVSRPTGTRKGHGVADAFTDAGVAARAAAVARKAS
jgi:ferredoxin